MLAHKSIVCWPEHMHMLLSPDCCTGVQLQSTSALSSTSSVNAGARICLPWLLMHADTTMGTGVLPSICSSTSSKLLDLHEGLSK